MTNIFRRIKIHLDCPQCDKSYDFPLAVIAESQQLLDEGCPGSSYECVPSFFAELVDPEALKALARAWCDVESSANGKASGMVFEGHLAIELSVGHQEKASPPSPECAGKDDHEKS